MLGVICIIKHTHIVVYMTGFDVSRSGGCSAYSYNFNWANRAGDQDQMGVDGTGVEGNNVQVLVQTRRNGGTWIRPLRGDMLRLPETEPQVMQTFS